MSVAGIVVNGHVEFETTSTLPEGTRVRIELDSDSAHDSSGEPEPRDRIEEIAILQASREDALAGRTKPARELLREIAIRHNLPLELGE